MKPVFGYCYFTVDRSGQFTEVIIFEYVDEDQEFAEILSDNLRLREELTKVRENMQSFIDAEEVRVNGKRVRPRIIKTLAGIAGDPCRPYISFIIRFRGALKPGLNVYEDKYEEDVAEYDYMVTWVLPPGSRVVEAEFGFKYEVGPDNVISFSVPKGSSTPGYEKILFYLPPLSEKHVTDASNTGEGS